MNPPLPTLRLEVGNFYVIYFIYVYYYYCCTTPQITLLCIVHTHSVHLTARRPAVYIYIYTLVGCRDRLSESIFTEFVLLAAGLSHPRRTPLLGHKTSCSAHSAGRVPPRPYRPLLPPSVARRLNFFPYHTHKVRNLRGIRRPKITKF